MKQYLRPFAFIVLPKLVSLAVFATLLAKMVHSRGDAVVALVGFLALAADEVRQMKVVMVDGAELAQGLAKNGLLQWAIASCMTMIVAPPGGVIRYVACVLLAVLGATLVGVIYHDTNHKAQPLS